MDLYTGEADIEPDGTVVRPALLTGGVLRRYQIDGLNWLKVGDWACTTHYYLVDILM